MKQSRWGAESRAKFLAKLAETANVTAAAKAAGCARKDMYELRAEDKDFAAAWDEAEARGCNAIEAEVWRHRIEGVECDVVQRNMVIAEGQALKIREYSAALLRAQLNAHRPENHSNRVERAAKDGRAPSRKLALIAFSDRLVAALNKAEVAGKRVAALNKAEVAGKGVAGAGFSYASIGEGSGNDAPVGVGIGALAPMR
jgi:hypothetical protein